MAGSSTGWAPRSASKVRSRDAWVRERVISTFLPKRGRWSNHPSRSRKATTGPIMATSGASSPASRPREATSARVPVTTRWLGQVPHWTRATGEVAGMPSFCNVCRMDSRAAQPISTTRVPPLRASISQRTDDRPLVGSSLPLITVKREARPRWVTGIPA